ncbi:hypothetical protein KCU89_g8, partial [Aureobasidium melanogenum]
LEVFVVRFFPNVFVALKSGFLPADTLVKGGCGGVVERWRFVVTRREVDSGSTCSSTRRTGALPRVDLGVTVEEPSIESSSASSSKCTCLLLWERIAIEVIVEKLASESIKFEGGGGKMPRILQPRIKVRESDNSQPRAPPRKSSNIFGVMCVTPSWSAISTQSARSSSSSYLAIPNALPSVLFRHLSSATSQ